jgi:ATP-binding protein involved in chromosome partitioning
MNMLRKVQVPILGIVENMAGLPLPDGTVVPVFGSGGGEKTAREFGVPLLAQIPIDLAIREGGDTGAPAACGTGATAERFEALAKRVLKEVNETGSPDAGVAIVN